MPSGGECRAAGGEGGSGIEGLAVVAGSLLSELREASGDGGELCQRLERLCGDGGKLSEPGEAMSEPGEAVLEPGEAPSLRSSPRAPAALAPSL